MHDRMIALPEGTLIGPCIFADGRLQHNAYAMICDGCAVHGCAVHVLVHACTFKTAATTFTSYLGRWAPWYLRTAHARGPPAPLPAPGAQDGTASEKSGLLHVACQSQHMMLSDVHDDAFAVFQGHTHSFCSTTTRQTPARQTSAALAQPPPHLVDQAVPLDGGQALELGRHERDLEVRLPARTRRLACACVAGVRRAVINHIKPARTCHPHWPLACPRSQFHLSFATWECNHGLAHRLGASCAHRSGRSRSVSLRSMLSRTGVRLCPPPPPPASPLLDAGASAPAEAAAASPPAAPLRAAASAPAPDAAACA